VPSDADDAFGPYCHQGHRSAESVSAEP